MAYPSSVGVLSGIESRQGSTIEHILKARAIGPNVPAIMGNADAANHHRLGIELIKIFWSKTAFEYRN
jgi:hypothetical protein